MTAHWFSIKKAVANVHSPICSRAAQPLFANGRPVTWFNIQIDSLPHALRKLTCTKTAAAPLPSGLNMDGTTLLQTFVVSDLCWEYVGAAPLSLSPVISFTPLVIHKTVSSWSFYSRQGCFPPYSLMHCAFFTTTRCFFGCCHLITWKGFSTI